jgi:tetratricopeptide (TPR) repeat protein
MNLDISEILDQWNFDSENNARKIMGADGKERIQVRLELGLMQMHCDGRPDGKRPHNKESLFNYHRKMLDQYIAIHGSDEGFKLDNHMCAELRQEGLLYYNRYLVLFQMEDYLRTARDTQRNTRLLDFVNQYASSKEDKTMLEQYHPYVIRMNSAALALYHVDRDRYSEALMTIRRGIEKIKRLAGVESSIFVSERKRSLHMLREMEKEIDQMRPLSKEEIMINKLNKAINEERYEDAAHLRDELKKLHKKIKH